MMHAVPPAIELCRDDELGYLRSRTRFTAGAGLALDETYRLAHLPLIAPCHPRVIRAREGTTYDMGRHARRNIERFRLDRIMQRWDDLFDVVER